MGMPFILHVFSHKPRYWINWVLDLIVALDTRWMWVPDVRWPTGTNAQQLKKTHANRQNTSKLRKHLHQFDNTRRAFRKHTNTGFSNTKTLQIQKRCKHRKRQQKCFQPTLKVLSCHGLLLMKLLKSGLCIISSCLCCEFLTSAAALLCTCADSECCTHDSVLVVTLPLSFSVFAARFCICSMFSKCCACVVKMKMLSWFACVSSLCMCVCPSATVMGGVNRVCCLQLTEGTRYSSCATF